VQKSRGRNVTVSKCQYSGVGAWNGAPIILEGRGKSCAANWGMGCSMRMRDANAQCECAMRMRDANARTIIPFDHQQSPKGRCRALNHLVIVAKVEIVIHNVNGSVHPPLVIKFVGQFVNNQDVPHVVKNWGAVN
jgi:hypothetical protein